VIEQVADENSIFIADGGDFVGAAAYVVRPRRPLTWLDPGVFGTLGCGAGFAMAAKLANPSSEAWLIWGDGASGFSLSEFDTLVRHKIPVIAVVG
jgi:thiamine pyrophosphate-dependent acetolactate synthase large subunit-like protein